MREFKTCFVTPDQFNSPDAREAHCDILRSCGINATIQQEPASSNSSDTSQEIAFCSAENRNAIAQIGV